MLRELFAYWPALEAAEQLRVVIGATAPHLKPGDQRRLRWHLDALMRSLAPPPPHDPPVEHIEIDREKAAAWFESRGAHVVRSEKVDAA
jgi:hypothetical protein